MVDVLNGWERREKPAMLQRRFTFDSYAQTRAFLDALAKLSELHDRHPQNISFGSTYANITLEAADGVALTTRDEDFAAQIVALSESLE